MFEAYPCYIVSDFVLHLDTLYNLISSGSENSSEKVIYTISVSFLRLLSDIGLCQPVKGLTYKMAPLTF